MQRVTDSVRQVGVPDGNLLLDLFVVQQRVGELLGAALDGTGVRPAEYAVYSQLGITGLSPGELTDRLGVTKSTLTGHLAALERRGHVRRRTRPEDGRSHRLELTAAGRRALERCRVRFRAALAAFEAALAVDADRARATLVAVDDALRRAVDLQRGSGPGG